MKFKSSILVAAISLFFFQYSAASGEPEISKEWKPPLYISLSYLDHRSANNDEYHDFYSGSFKAFNIGVGIPSINPNDTYLKHVELNLYRTLSENRMGARIDFKSDFGVIRPLYLHGGLDTFERNEKSKFEYGFLVGFGVAFNHETFNFDQFSVENPIGKVGYDLFLQWNKSWTTSGKGKEDEHENQSGDVLESGIRFYF